jgi:hypothetical protein
MPKRLHSLFSVVQLPVLRQHTLLPAFFHRQKYLNHSLVLSLLVQTKSQLTFNLTLIKRLEAGSPFDEL